MTRASERLVIGGIMPTRDVSENSWHKRVRAALSSLGAMPEEDGRWGTIWRYRGSVPERKLEPRAARAQNGPPPRLPHWVRASAPAEPRPPRPLAPSQVAEDREPSPPPSPALRAAAQRGTIIHHLLERLVEVPPEDRRERAIAWLERSAGVAVATDRQKIADQVCSVLADPSFSELFGPGSLGEAPLAATLPDGRVIAGTVDRLLIEEGRVSVLDFKTGRVPSAASAIPAAHLAQMKAYTEALQVIFPAREIRAALLYTAGPQLFDLAS
jgi:ATP-dependent helicase/nuclease subunit A